MTEFGLMTHPLTIINQREPRSGFNYRIPPLNPLKGTLAERLNWCWLLTAQCSAHRFGNRRELVEMWLKPTSDY